MGLIRSLGAVALCVACACLVPACDAPSTHVVLDNDYLPTPTEQLVVYRAFWQAISFATPLPPGTSSDPQSTVAASANTAYVLLAPGWDPAPDGGVAPASLVVLSSHDGYGVHLGATLHIPVDDAHFDGRCGAGAPLAQPQADFITERVFASDFAGRSYYAATCTTSGP